MAIPLTKFADLMQRLSINSLEWSSVLSKKTDGQLGLERIAIESGNKKIADREEVFPLNEDVLKE